MSSALFMVTWQPEWSLKGSCELNWLGGVFSFYFSILFFSYFFPILSVVQTVRSRWPGRALGIVATMKPSLIRIASGRLLDSYRTELAGGRGWKSYTGLLLLFSYWVQARDCLHEKSWGNFRALPSPFHLCHIQCWACCKKDWTELIIKTQKDVELHLASCVHPCHY